MDFCHLLPLYTFGQYFLSSDAIINENYDYLKGFLEDLAPLERSGLIQDWETSGLVYLDYIRVIEMLRHIQQVPELLKPWPGILFPWPIKP